MIIFRNPQNGDPKLIRTKAPLRLHHHMQAKTNLVIEDTSVGDEVLGKTSLILEENEEIENGGGFRERKPRGEVREMREMRENGCV